MSDGVVAILVLALVFIMGGALGFAFCEWVNAWGVVRSLESERLLRDQRRFLLELADRLNGNHYA